MGRKIKRVPLDFDHPLDTAWEGYLNPYHSDNCPSCEGKGYSPEARRLYDQWYGYSEFSPAETGNPFWSPENEIIYNKAKRNIGRGQWRISAEANRLAQLFNSAWTYNLDQEDVYALCMNDRLWDFTRVWNSSEGWQKKRWETHGFWCPKGKESVPQLSGEHHSAFCTEHQCDMVLLEPDDVRLHVPLARDVNRWSIQGFGHDSINAAVCIQAKCERLGIPVKCDQCHGTGEFWESEELKALHDAWAVVEPPTGDGWQVWETVSEGSPVSPVFSSSTFLVRWLVEEEGYSPLAAEEFVKSGWVPSGVLTQGVAYSGIESAVLYHGTP